MRLENITSNLFEVYAKNKIIQNAFCAYYMRHTVHNHPLFSAAKFTISPDNVKSQRYASRNDILSLNVIRSSIISANSIRFKKKAKSTVTDSEDESGTVDEFEETITDRSSKILDVQVNSLRADLLLKAGLGMARNKVETLFYESKIRVNGEKLLKKSAQIEVGDEIDIIKGSSPNNPEHLNVARVEILAAKERDGSVKVKLRRCKSLTVENYDDKRKSD